MKNNVNKTKDDIYVCKDGVSLKKSVVFRNPRLFSSVTGHDIILIVISQENTLVYLCIWLRPLEREL